jgi:glycosyltransferase involved in cell wall biosynthesis
VSRIGINLLYINPKLAGGSVTYALKLIKEISLLDQHNEYVIYINKECKNINFEFGRNFEIRVLNFEYSSVYLRYFWEQIILPFYIFKDKVDLVHSLGYVTPLLTSAKKVVSILDINYRGHLSNMSPSKRFLLGSMVNLSAIFSKKIITISHFSKNQIIKHTKANGNKIIVTLLSGSNDNLESNLIADTSIALKYNIDSDYIIAFSSPSPHKNIHRLLESFKVVSKSKSDLKLVLVGHKHKSHLLEAIIKDLELVDKVIFTSFIPDNDINPLITSAKAFVFPSLYEGFGIPLLDAQACKVPVASSNAGSLPEVGGTSVFYFNPYDINSMSVSILKAIEISDNLNSKIVEHAFDNRKLFSWLKTAQETLNVYNELLKNK